jgi:CBS domain-containing protein
MAVPDRVSAILKQKGSEVWWISPGATVYDALEMMANKGVGALVVLNTGTLVGLLSERDYARKIILKGRSSRDTRVEDIMNAPPITITPDCSVNEAMQIMTDNRIRHLPVVDEQRGLRGMVSIGDLVKWIITSQEETIEQLHSYITGKS